MLQERVATPNLRGSDEFAPLHEDLSPNGQRETGRRTVGRSDGRTVPRQYGVDA